MKRLLGILLTMLFLQTSVHAVDKVRIGFPDRAAQFIPLPLGEQRGFFREEGLQGRVHPDSANRCDSGISQRRNRLLHFHRLWGRRNGSRVAG